MKRRDFLKAAAALVGLVVAGPRCDGPVLAPTCRTYTFERRILDDDGFCDDLIKIGQVTYTFKASLSSANTDLSPRDFALLRNIHLQAAA